MPKPVIINHGGRRDFYQLSVAFAEARLLEALVTDFYYTIPASWVQTFHLEPYIRKRYHPSIPAGRVHIPVEAPLNMLVNVILKKKSLINRRNVILANAALTLARKRAANFFLYSYTAFEAFRQAREEQLPAKRILFQLHPNPEFIKQILEEEFDRYPFAKKSLMFEDELNPDNNFFRLKEEPHLAEHIFVASSFTKKTLTQTGIPAERINVVPYGIDGKSFPFEPRGGTSGPLKLLFVGQLVQRKGIADLLGALNRLSSKQIELTICTRGFFDQDILSAFPAVKVIVHRNVSHEGLLHALKSADLFVFPSLAEGFGFAILEAMHSGLPVITTENTCGADMIVHGQNGFLTPVKDPEALASNIEHCINHRDSLQEIGLQAHLTAAEYTWNRFRQDVVHTYRSIA